MSLKSSSALNWLLVLCGMLPVASICAHNLESAGGAQRWKATRESIMPGEPTLLRIQRDGLSETLQSVVDLRYTWPAAQTVRVCFYGGDEALRKRILEAAQPWFKHGSSVVIDSGGAQPRTCSMHDASEIRISFDEPGYWSYVGHQYQKELRDRGLSTLNLQGYDSEPPDEPVFSGKVLHEFGHALGFDHEHQSPANECAEQLDWTKVIAYFQKEYGWPPAKTKTNLEPLQADRRAYDWSDFDPNSIMIYASKREYLKDGAPDSCVFHDNNTLSNQDIAGLLKAYPPVHDPVLENDVRLSQIGALLKHGAITDVQAKATLTAQKVLLERAVQMRAR
jgi:hypothetical protein